MQIPRFLQATTVALGLLASTACGAQTPPAARTAAVDSIPFELEDSRIYVPVTDSSGTLGWFIFDTGAQPSGVDVAVAERWGARALDSSLTTGAGGGRTRRTSIAGRTVHVGPVPFRPERLSVLPLDSLLGAVSGRRIAGLIGSAFFHAHTVTIDFDRRMIYVRPPGSSSATDAGSTALRFALRGDVPFISGSLRLPDGRRLDASYLIDLGAKATVLYSEPFVERHGVAEAIRGPSFTAPLGAGVGGRTRYRFVRVPEVTLGPGAALRWSDLVVGLSVDGTLRSSYYDGLFGLDMLQQFTPTFDYARSRLVLAPRANPPASSEIDLSGLFLVEERSPRAVRVDAVVEHSPASDAGIAVGDEIARLDGRPASEMTLAQMRDLLRSRPGRRVELELRRGGRTITRAVTLRRMA